MTLDQRLIGFLRQRCSLLARPKRIARFHEWYHLHTAVKVPNLNFERAQDFWPACTVHRVQYWVQLSTLWARSQVRARLAVRRIFVLASRMCRFDAGLLLSSLSSLTDIL